MRKLARKVVTRSGRKTRGYFPSAKLGRMVEWESLLERDAILLFEFSRGVVSYQEQPELVFYPDGDEMRRYFPDFQITGRDKQIIHLEVKPQAQLNRPDVAKKLQSVATHYVKNDRQYRILTEMVIRREPLHSNLTMLTRYRREDQQIDALRVEVLARLVNTPRPFAELASLFGHGAVLKLIALGDVWCDLTNELAGMTIYHPKEADHAAVFF